jgi:hypothetical protein
MSDFSRSDLGGVERQLDRIAEKLSGGRVFTDARYLLATDESPADEMMNLLKEVSRKLDRG